MQAVRLGVSGISGCPGSMSAGRARLLVRGVARWGAAVHCPEGRVRQAAESAVEDLLAFANVDFAQPLYLSDVYGKVEALAGVNAMTVLRFRREDSATALLTAPLTVQTISQLAAQLPGIDVNALIQRALQIDVATDGRIEIQEFEIPVLGNLDITLVESTQ